MKKYVWLLILAIVVIDQGTKYWAVQALHTDQLTPIIGQVLSLQLVRNPGAAFSLAPSLTLIFSLVALVVIAICVYVIHVITNRYWLVAIACLVGGSSGNLIDRLIQPPGFGNGHVIDFINYGGKFVGNVADIAIVFSVAVILILSLRGTPARQVAKHDTPTCDSEATVSAESVR